MTKDISFREEGVSIIKTEIEGLQQMADRLDGHFDEACEKLLDCRGRIIVTGMGKSGHIGSKIAAAFASTGSPSFFVHPAEASHGDSGMITKEDVVLAISYSGKTDEILNILPLIKRLGVPLITLTGDQNSILAKQADVNIDIGVIKEADQFNIVPTTSTTVSLVVGDALVMALFKARGLTEEDFSLRHPGGALGRKLLWRIKDIMHTGPDVPKVFGDTLLKEALIEMSRKRLGMTVIVDEEDQVVGVFTDGDLRRTMDRCFDIYTTKISTVMTKNVMSIHPDMLAAKALYLMGSLRFNGFPVIDENKKLIGALNLHDFLRAGLL